MKLTILLSSAILFATALTPISAYADDSNLMCRRSNCDSRGGGNGNLSISGLDITVKSSDRGNRNRNTVDRNAPVGPDSNRDENVANTENDNSVGNNTDTAATDNNNDNNNDNIVDADNGTENDTGPVADNNNSNSPPQSNSNDIKGFDPFGGLYGPGT